MLNFYEDLLKPDHILEINRVLFNKFNRRELTMEEQPMYLNNCYGIGNLKETITDIDNIKELISKDYGDDFQFTHSYTRIYSNNGVLFPHIDRQGLDLTLSVNIYSNLPVDWPLWVSPLLYPKEKWDFETEMSPYRQTATPYNTRPGQGVACFGTKHVHWRERLVCEPFHYYGQIFYHWKKVK
jgi:hypothetical protein